MLNRFKHQTTSNIHTSRLMAQTSKVLSKASQIKINKYALKKIKINIIMLCKKNKINHAHTPQTSNSHKQSI